MYARYSVGQFDVAHEVLLEEDKLRWYRGHIRPLRMAVGGFYMWKGSSDNDTV